jgi:hypothetical protein
MNRVPVQLTKDELLYAAKVAAHRQVSNLFNGAAHRYGASGQHAWQMHIEGCLGEAAVAKHYGLEWDGAIGNYRAKDAGPLQVRSTWYRKGMLCIHPSDDDDDAFVLAITCDEPVIVLIGWSYGVEAKRGRYWRTAPGRDDRPAYWVPQPDLRPMSQLEVSR